MKIKKFLISLIVIFMAISSLALNVAFAEEDEQNDFSGTRTFTIYSDLSNLKNYIELGQKKIKRNDE